MRPPGERVLLQRVAFALVELLRGGLERPRQPIELARRRVAEAAVEERRRDPDGGAERQQGRGEERGDQPGAQTSHRGRRRAARRQPERTGLERMRRRLGLAAAAQRVDQRLQRVAGVGRIRARVAIQNAVLEPNPERQVAAQRAERAHGNGQLLDAPGLGGGSAQVRNRPGTRIDRGHGESFLPEIVAQREDPPGRGRGRLPGRGQHRRDELDAHRAAVLQSRQRISLQKAEAGRVDPQRVADRVDGHRLRRHRASAPTPAAPSSTAAACRADATTAAPGSGSAAPCVNTARQVVGVQREADDEEGRSGVEPEACRRRGRGARCSRPRPNRRRGRARVRCSDTRSTSRPRGRRRPARCRTCPSPERRRVAEREALEERRVSGDASGHAARLHVMPSESRIDTSPGRGTSCRRDRSRARGSRRARRSCASTVCFAPESCFHCRL